MLRLIEPDFLAQGRESEIVSRILTTKETRLTVAYQVSEATGSDGLNAVIDLFRQAIPSTRNEGFLISTTVLTEGDVTADYVFAGSKTIGLPENLESYTLDYTYNTGLYMVDGNPLSFEMIPNHHLLHLESVGKSTSGISHLYLYQRTIEYEYVPRP